MQQLNLPYRPRPYQSEFENAMFSGKRRAFLLYHRRCGKDIACFNFLINCAITDGGLYYYILPTYRQAKRVIWDGIDESGKRLLDFLPKELIDGKPNNTEMKVRLFNGAMIQMVGSENYDALRGTNPSGVVFSEYAMQDPRAWTEVISPILAKNGGWAVFNTTPLGKNHAYDLWMMAKKSDDWYTQKLTIEDTNLIPRSVIDREIAEGKSEEIIQQEYYCSFARGIDGCYYGRLMSKADDNGRITRVPYQLDLPVHTAWDLGIGDSTSIWWYQVTPGGEIHFLEYYENAGEALQHYVGVVSSKDYLYGKHFFPHDVKARELGAGISREEQLRKMHLKPSLVPKHTVDDGHQSVRAILPRSWFDATKCKEGIKHLENYRKHYSDKLRCFTDRPLHDEHSHGADAMRYAAISIMRPQRSKMTKERAAQMYNQYTPNV